MNLPQEKIQMKRKAGRGWPFAIFGLFVAMAIFNGGLIYYALQAGANDHYLKNNVEDTK